jgi:poly(3-hydroxybutyrate) depolymerase
MRAAVLAIVLAACGGGGIDGVGDAAGPNADASGPDAPPPMPSGCVTDVSSGDHTYTCGGLKVDARIPPQCQAPGCGLILVLHGDTGSGLLMDAHVKMRELGAANGYIVIAPSGPPWNPSNPAEGSTWNSSNDATLVDMTTKFRDAFRVNPKKIHVTGFSRGGFVTWRLLCDHADLFASAAPAGAGFGGGFGETTCFQNQRAPSRKIPITFLMGRTDVSVGYTNMVNIRNAAITNYGATGPTVLAGDAEYTHNQWMGSGAVIETWDHAYENYPTSDFASAKGHCIVGSTTDPTAPQYAIPCEPPNAFVWGEEVMKFFMANPMP